MLLKLNSFRNPNVKHCGTKSDHKGPLDKMEWSTLDTKLDLHKKVKKATKKGAHMAAQKGLSVLTR